MTTAKQLARRRLYNDVASLALSFALLKVICLILGTEGPLWLTYDRG